jgi:hypothetical protein
MFKLIYQMNRRLLSYIIAATATTSLLAAPIDYAKQLYLNGNYTAAVKELKVLHQKTPKDSNVNYYLGASYFGLNDYTAAKSPLTVAENAGIADASHLLAKIAINNYQLDDAETHMKKWSALLRKAKRQEPAEYSKLQEQANLMTNMLERVENIAVIDSMVVDATDFFKYYNLSKDAGRILTPEDMSVGNATIIYTPAIGKEIIWAEPDDNGKSHLMGAGVLDDGSIEHAAPLNDELGNGGNATYPFMLADGMTLYFASDGEGSIGGYDIFMSRRNDNGFLQPQNIGMPYNSPYDDYMLAIDEAHGIGWWATDRNHIAGKVTIYIFEQPDKRTNCDTDDEDDLIARARITSIAATQDPDKDYSELIALSRTATDHHSESASNANSVSFRLSMGDGHTVYHKLSDFRNVQAREHMIELLDLWSEISTTESRLASLRSSYAKGDRSAANEITSLESKLESQRSNESELSNAIIRLERY